MCKQIQCSYLLITLFIIVFFNQLSKAQIVAWANQASPKVCSAIGADTLGNCYITGGCGNVATFGSFNITLPISNADYIYIAKYGHDGDCVWAKTYGKGNSNGMVVDKDGNSYITGQGILQTDPNADTAHIPVSSSSYSFIFKCDKNGRILWAKTIGEISYYHICNSKAISIDESGNIFVTGTFSKTLKFDSNILYSFYSSLFVAKYDINGNFLWAKQADVNSGSAQISSNSISADLNHNCYLTGFYSDKIKFGTGDSAITLGSPYNCTSVFVAKYDSKGNFVWAKRAGDRIQNEGDILVNTGNSAKGFGISADPKGNVYITGTFGNSINFGSLSIDTYKENTDDMFTAKYNTGGELIWAIHAGGAFSTSGTSISLDKLDNFYVTGYFSGPASFGDIPLPGAINPHTFIARYDTSGHTLYAQQAGGNSSHGSSIFCDIKGNCYTTGNFQWSINFVDIKMLYCEAMNIYITKLVPSIATAKKPETGIETLDFGKSKIKLTANIIKSDTITVTFYASSLPEVGKLPEGIKKVNNYYWLISSLDINFTNGIIEVPISTLPGYSDTLKYLWLKREKSGDAWTSIGGKVDNGNLQSTMPFTSFCEFAIGEIDNSTGIVEKKNYVPEKYSLEQNYPNPFNPTTTINYEIVNSCYVELKVFDMLGREISTLVNKEQTKGKYSVQFDGKELASGMYIYRLKAGDFTKTNKMSILK